MKHFLKKTLYLSLFLLGLSSIKASAIEIMNTSKIRIDKRNQITKWNKKSKQNKITKWNKKSKRVVPVQKQESFTEECFKIFNALFK